MMINELVIVNLRPNGSEPIPNGLTNLQWQTTFADKPGAQTYFGRDAYQFLLEVICGLHSPLVGENAVMGQFRQFRNAAQFPNTAWGKFLRKVTTDVLVDARQVRHRHLEGLGSQSYGSLIRKHLKGQSSVAVLGAGSLGSLTRASSIATGNTRKI
jgi:glutamyl-tRNA reductase